MGSNITVGSLMAWTSSRWATLLPLVEKASGKELLIAAAPVLLAIPGFVDEALAVIVGMALVASIFFLRKYLNSHAGEISRGLIVARDEGTISQSAAASALDSLNRLTVSADT